LINDLKAAKQANRADAGMSSAQNFQRKAQFYLDFVEAENSTGFHAPQEAARILGESINFSRQGQNTLRGQLPAPPPAPASAPEPVKLKSVTDLCGAGSLITRPEILSRALLKGGTEEQRQKWLPQVAMGDPLCAIAVTEPDTGSDVAAMRLKASKCAGGWILDGVKTWCTMAGKAGVLLVLARSNPDRSLGHKGLSMFLVEKDSYDGHDFEYRQAEGGVLSGRAIATIGYRGMHSYEVFFDHVFVPDENLVGGPEGEGKGFYFTMAGFAGGRIQTAARAIGVMQAAFERAVSYAQERQAFGKPIGDFQLTRAKLARMATLLTVSRQFTYAVGRLMDQGQGQMEASMVKLFTCRTAEWLTREAMQIHGGMGYAEESPVSRYFLDARVLSIFEGAEETLALKVIARALIDAV